MRTVHLRAPAPIETAPLVIEEREALLPGPGEVGIRVHACGVCHTDLHIAEGDLPPHRLPVVLGHQIVGTVDRLGPDVTPDLEGRRVGVTWLAHACGACAFCVSGEENLCPQAQFTGYDVDGGFADRTLARAAFVVPIPLAFDDAAAAPLLCAGVIGYRALRVAGLQPGERLALFGFGASAHLAIQVARHWGCEVGVVTRGAAEIPVRVEAESHPLEAANEILLRLKRRELRAAAVLRPSMGAT